MNGAERLEILRDLSAEAWSSEVELRPPTQSFFQFVLVRAGSMDPPEGCGDLKAFLCMDHAPPVRLEVPMHCGKRSCKNDVKRWAWRTANEAVDRLRHGARFWCVHKGLRHVTLSRESATVPTTRKALGRERAKVYAVLEKMGFLGGLAVYHPWRHAGCDDWFTSPHWHVVGYGRVDADKRPPGWFVKTIPRGKKRSWTATVKYVLDHAGFEEPRGHALTWFGGWAYNRLPRGIRSLPVKVRGPPCPVCGKEMVPEVLHDFTAKVSAGTKGAVWEAI